MTRGRTFIAGGVAILVVVGVVYMFRDTFHHTLSTLSGSSTPLVNQATLQALPHKSASGANLSHLASGLTPPTNMWLSGMVLQQTPQPVYPLPLSFLAKDTGFELGLPTVSSQPTQISGEHVPGVMVGLPATSFQLTRYDKLSATLTYSQDSQTVGSVTIAEGSPFVFYTAKADTTLTLSGVNPADIASQSAHYLRYNATGHTYAISSGGASITDHSVTVHAGDTVAFYALPGSTDTLRQYAGAAIQSVDVTHTQSGGTVSTTFAYKTTGGKQTVFAALPYEHMTGKTTSAYQTIYGQMQLQTGTQFTTEAPAVTPSDELSLAHLTDTQKQQLSTLLATDVAQTKIDQQDSYYAGKQLARAANLLDIAEQLHQTTQADKLKSILAQAFSQRLGGKYFYYDTALHGIAPNTAAFGSQDFNDHHFHYGYWLYAGSIVARYDNGFVKQYKNQLDLLAADIASYQTSSQFPLYRTYDPYADHSWADGLSPFADGNDQESSSEAMNAWNSVSLWGAATGNKTLEQTGQWMLAGEAQAAKTTWRSVDSSDPALHGYTSPVVGIDFGGKRVYSTWFSDDPAAKLGIQLIPMNPSMAAAFAGDSHISTTINDTISGNNYNVPLGDYILMYLSLSDPDAAARLAATQTNIDDGNSRTYLYAFIFSQQDK